MITFRIPSDVRSRALMGVFLLYIFGLLGFLGSSHQHNAASPQAHEGCQLCQISTQPYLAAAPAPAPAPCRVFFHLPDADPEPLRLPRHFHFSSRGPPSA